MKSSKTYMLVTGLFIVAMGSGVILGLSLGRTPPVAASGERSWLAEELKLTPSQRDQMRAVWNEFRNFGSKEREARRALARERDEAIAKLIKDDQRGAYNMILDGYNLKRAQMDKDREALFQSAVAQTKELLDAEQRAKYEELVKKGFRGTPWGRPATTTSGPATTRKREE